jgi:hypothetical protein
MGRTCLAKWQQEVQIGVSLMKNFDAINESISTLEPYKGFDEGTYYTMSIFNEFCKTRDLKHVAIFGYYKSKYRWNIEQAQEMYDKAPDGWTDGIGVYRKFDWGKGENKIECGEDWEWHEPQLDHIVHRSRAKAMGWTPEQINHPSNFQVLPAFINRILSNLTDEQAPAVLPIILAQFPDLK